MKKLVRFILFSVGVAVAAPAAVADEPLKATIDPESAFIPLWEAILKESDINYAFYKMPPIERRQAFASGKVALDCCVAREWCQRPEERAVQLFSQPIAHLRLHLVMRPGLSVKPEQLNDLSAYTFGGVAGYDYTLPSPTKSRIDAKSLRELLDWVQQGKVDFTYLNYQDIGRMERHRGQKFNVGPRVREIPIYVRVHKDHRPLMVKINKTIDALKKSRRIYTLVAAGIRDGL